MKKLSNIFSKQYLSPSFFKLFRGRYLCVLIILFFANIVNAQKANKGTRILFLMDASSSMTYKWHDSTNRFAAASRIVLSIIDSMYAINNEVEFAVRTYGTEYEVKDKNCFDTKLEVPFNLQNVSQIKQKLKFVKPLGSSPIAYSLKEASLNELSNTNDYEYSFILLTDGGESCGGNICDMYKKLVENKIKVTPYVIGLDTNTQLLQYYNCLGQYVGVTSPGDIATAVKLIVNNNRILLEKPKTKNITTTFSDSKPLAKPNPIIITDTITYKIIDQLKTKPLVGISTNYKLSVPDLKSLKIGKNAYNIKIADEPLTSNAIATLNTNKLLVFKSNYKNPLLKKVIIPKQALPNINIEPEFTTSNIGFLPANSIKSFNTISLKNPNIKKLLFTKASLPNINIEPEFTASTFTAIASNNIKTLNKISLKTPLPKKLIISKTALPNINIEPEFTASTFTAIASNNIKTLNKISLKAPLLKKLIISKTALPNINIEPEFTASAVPFLQISTRKPTYNTQFIAAKPNTIKFTKANLPNISLEPEIKQEAIASIFPAQFRISFPPKSSDSIRTMRLKKLVLKPNDAIAKLSSKFVPKPTPKPKPVLAPDGPTEFKVETTASELSQIAVYFTDGNGKFYSSKPMVAILDAITKTEKQKFMRDILKNGEPEPVDLKVFGTVDVTVLGRRDLQLKNVKLEPNKLNKIIIKVSNGTLEFSFRTDLTTPVPFEARITKRWIQSPSFTYMSCAETKFYDPGEYYIEISSLPPIKLRTEISFGFPTLVQISKAGNLIFTNQEAIGEITLYNQDGEGENFAPFHELNFNGGGNSKPLGLQPGLYKAEFMKPGSPKFSAPIIVDFKIEAEKETYVELKNYNGLLITPSAIGTMRITNETPDIKLK